MFCAIIGYPLKKPRSVKIWKEFFLKKKIDMSMKQLEIPNHSFSKKIQKLIKNKNFLASAVTMPYKKKILKYVSLKDKISKIAKSVNFIIRKKKIIEGYNTDVYGALISIKKISIKKDLIIYGFGGAGEAICRALYDRYKKMKITVISKKNKPSDLKNKRIKFCKTINNKLLKKTDVFINCSPLGSTLKKSYINKTPLDLKMLKNVKSNFFVFDIIYNPKKTTLLKNCEELNINNMNGLEMNTYQAKFALEKVFKEYNKID
jgi:shikimate dehydrogenase